MDGADEDKSLRLRKSVYIVIDGGRRMPGIYPACMGHYAGHYLFPPGVDCGGLLQIPLQGRPADPGSGRIETNSNRTPDSQSLTPSFIISLARKKEICQR